MPDQVRDGKEMNKNERMTMMAELPMPQVLLKMSLPMMISFFHPGHVQYRGFDVCGKNLRKCPDRGLPGVSDAADRDGHRGRYSHRRIGGLGQTYGPGRTGQGGRFHPDHDRHEPGFYRAVYYSGSDRAGAAVPSADRCGGDCRNGGPVPDHQLVSVMRLDLRQVL